ncbi:hypothetical protein [Haliangium ochraceum]|uniref:Uncharacterized protein n=1 Tax=Haliangium ochraceum (strain DSM 14365 / JCM 11303 / SMP-2) TaxID=502025 RepID=D0LTV2_HALO1|nr:hypothetical protein [Haliangium ochraceum]ACY15796.1 hypothetical protein Hoch_3294 [Haliangium ochraceum DSM 14365]
MATKNLARTVVEGGRVRWNRDDRRYSNRRIRRNVRMYAHGLRLDPEASEERAAPQRVHVVRFHYDRLAVVERWLASFIGQPWNDVRAEMARRFDIRTIAGQHIVFDHLLPSVKGSGQGEHFGRKRFAIDADGLLQRVPWRRAFGADS